MFATKCEPRAVVRVRVRGNVVRVRVNETAIRIRVVRGTTDNTAPGTLYLFALAFAELGFADSFLFNLSLSVRY